MARQRPTGRLRAIDWRWLGALALLVGAAGWLAGAAADGADPADDPAPPRTVTGLFDEPRLRAADATRALPEPPPTPFDRPPAGAAVLFDMATDEVIDLGPGVPGRFSPDGRWFAWLALPEQRFSSGEVRLLDLTTREQRALGPASFVLRFEGPDALLVQAVDSGATERIDLASGARTPGGPNPLAGAVISRVTPEGYLLLGTPLDARAGPFTATTWEVRDPRSGATLLTFTAGYHVFPAGPGELVVATPPRDGTANIFLVAIASGQATFIATTTLAPPRWEGDGFNWPRSASRDYVFWAGSYCAFGAFDGQEQPIDAGGARLYDRRADKITEWDRAEWAELLPSNLLVLGEFGSGPLFDPATWTFRATLPAGSDTFWSPDGRYAARGLTGGHGGLCP